MQGLGRASLAWAIDHGPPQGPCPPLPRAKGAGLWQKILRALMPTPGTLLGLNHRGVDEVKPLEALCLPCFLGGLMAGPEGGRRRPK